MAATITTGGSEQPFGYTGEQRDGVIGFLYLRVRIRISSSG